MSGPDVGDNRGHQRKGSLGMITTSRSVPANGWRSRCAAICDAQFQQKRGRLRTYGGRIDRICSTALHSFERGLGFRAILRNDAGIDISSGKCRSNERYGRVRNVHIDEFFGILDTRQKETCPPVFARQFAWLTALRLASWQHHFRLALRVPRPEHTR